MFEDPQTYVGYPGALHPKGCSIQTYDTALYVHIIIVIHMVNN